MASEVVVIGIDVAMAKGKSLPICVAALRDRLTPLMLVQEPGTGIPAGVGNQEIELEEPFQALADRVAARIAAFVDQRRWQVAAIAIDAPAQAPQCGKREAEAAANRSGVPLYATPDSAKWREITLDSRRHLAEGGAVARIPHANRIWMLYGFALFTALRKTFRAPVLETYPYAVVRQITGGTAHKSTAAGYGSQLEAIAARTGWTAADLENRLRACVGGTRHDRLDAFMAAWVASLWPGHCSAYGNPDDLNDSIWYPAA